jgi:hypothetical protein
VVTNRHRSAAWSSSSAVLGLDRVDVGRVDQGDLGEGAVVDGQLEAVGVGQGGQHLAGHEGVDLAGGQ